MITLQHKVFILIILSLSLCEEIIPQSDTAINNISDIRFIDFQFSGDSDQVFGNGNISDQLNNASITIKGEISNVIISWDLKEDSDIYAKNEFFSYLLEGYDDDWHIEKSKFAKYKNLTPGQYLLKVRKGKYDYNNDDNFKVLNIIILPQIWQTWWFRFVVFAFIVIVVIIVIIVTIIIVVSKTNRV
jgi:hypothetical protein